MGLQRVTTEWLNTAHRTAFRLKNKTKQNNQKSKPDVRKEGSQVRPRYRARKEKDQ